jgi:HAD superfamily hydrolase (TIGR01549 family)
MRLALFDLDNTLVDRGLVIRRHAADFAEIHGLDPAEAVPALVAADDDGRTGWEERYGILRQQFDLAQTVAELVALHRGHFLDRYRAEPAVLDALAALRADGWRVGIVTNGPAFQADKLRAAGLHRAVDGYVVSDLAGARKPDPALFAAAARACGWVDGGPRWDEGWMVGDSPPADIAGARAAGLTAVWLHRGRDWDEAAALPDAYAVRMGEPVTDLSGLRPDHVVDDIPAAVALMIDPS